MAALVCLYILPIAEVSAEPIAAGRTAPTLVLRQADGKAVSLSGYRGKVVLLNFWATWCAPCRVEMPWFEEFSKVYTDRGLVVLGVSLDDDGWKAIQPAVAKLGISYPILLGDAKTMKNYGIGELLPVTFLIDRHGKIRILKVGFGDKMEFEKSIEQLLHEE
ncbi:TlpA disulfide reductase family protein [Granulicella arctica]|uniref:TlpA disulfide reductase family protein n=1 Tax=Granulicella arctica TaxID=940613 RepID=UPI0021E0D209|nr:TlpA disulfide reductase family protein [Granulicella arctica]